MSLLHKSVYKYLVTDWGLQGREDSFVIGLSSCAYQMHAYFQKALPPVAKSMESLLERAYRRFAELFEPEGQWVLEVGNPYQFALWLQVAADSIIRAAESPLRYDLMNSSNRESILKARLQAPRANVFGMGVQEPKR